MFLLVFLFRLRVIGTSIISDENATLTEILAGLIVFEIIFYLAEFVLKFHWTIVLSICVGYAVMASKIVRKATDRFLRIDNPTDPNEGYIQIKLKP